MTARIMTVISFMSSASPAWLPEDTQANLPIDKKPPGVARAICAPNQVRLPRSATRRDTGTWIKLLERVTDSPGGFGFEGKLLRPGETIPAGQLPEPAVLLECAGTEGRGRGHNRGDVRYIVWRWDRSARDWQELAQCSSVSGDWALALNGVALRALHPDDQVITPFDCEASVDRILSFAESEMHGMQSRLRNRVLERLYGRIAGFIAA